MFSAKRHTTLRGKASEHLIFSKGSAARSDLDEVVSDQTVQDEVENYPNLKADQGFLGLQTQLEGSENRITVARGRYIKAVQDYNTYIRQFPVNLTAMVFGHKAKPNFTVQNERAIQDAPTVDFNTAPAPQPAPAG